MNRPTIVSLVYEQLFKNEIRQFAILWMLESQDSICRVDKYLKQFRIERSNTCIEYQPSLPAFILLQHLKLIGFLGGVELLKIMDENLCSIKKSWIFSTFR